MTPMLGAPLVVVVAAYLLGTFPTAALIGRMTGHDPTAEGSGNPGATNVLRTSGRGRASPCSPSTWPRARWPSAWVSWSVTTPSA